MKHDFNSVIIPKCNMYKGGASKILMLYTRCYYTR